MSDTNCAQRVAFPNSSTLVGVCRLMEREFCALIVR